MIKLSSAILMLACVLCSCKQKEEVYFTYTNPNTQVVMRDTHIIANYDDGKFYAVGTIRWGDRDSDGEAGFRLYVSENLKDWEAGPWILKQSEIPETAWYRGLFWAPEIHKINGKWYFTYNCHGTQNIDPDLFAGPHGSGISVADRITGPYEILAEKPLAPWPTNDLTLFQDEDGTVYAFFNNGFFNMETNPDPRHSIFVAEVDLDKGILKEEPVKLITQQDGFEAPGIEGAHLVKIDDTYYLFYSGWGEGYAVGYATADNVYGPYTRAADIPLFGARTDGGMVKDGKILYDTDNPYIEVGHNQIFRGPDGGYWTSCHAYVKGGDNRFGSFLLYDRLEFKDGRIISDIPTWTPQTVKVSPEMLKYFPGLGY